MRIFLLVGLLIVIAASAMVVGQGRKATNSRTSTPQANVKSKVKDEANEESIKAWDKYVTKCEDSYYMRPCCNGKGDICEYRLVSITSEELPVNEPDRLNGIERKLVSYFAAKAERCQRGSGWEEWHTAGRMPMDMIKRSGTWSADKPKYNAFWAMTNTKVSCPGAGISPQQVPLTNKGELQAPARFRLKDDLTSKGSSWSRVDSATWVENNPNGRTFTFRIAERTTVNDIQGTVLRRNPDNLEIFVPDVNSGSMLLKFRVQGNNEWRPLREMVDVEPM